MAQRTKEGMRAQTAIEFITDYGWALLIIGISIAVLVIYAGPRGTSSKIPSECNIQPSLPCRGVSITSFNSTSKIRFTVSFVNNLGSEIEFTGNEITLTTDNLGKSGQSSTNGLCRPDIVPNGGVIICNVSLSGTSEPSIGTILYNTFNISYTICSSTNIPVCSGNYITSGWSLQELSPPAAGLHSLSLIVSPNDGSIYVQGIPYVNGTTIPVYPGNYVIYASPNYGYSFSSWSNTGSSSLPPSAPQRTTLDISGNSTLTANLGTSSSTTIKQLYTISTVKTSVSIATLATSLTSSSSTLSSSTLSSSTLSSSTLSSSTLSSSTLSSTSSTSTTTTSTTKIISDGCKTC